MKTVFLSLLVVVSLASCYKSKCHTCTTKFYRNGILKSTDEIKYCDKTRKEIKNKEGSFTNEYYDSILKMNVKVKDETTCD